MHTLNIMAMIFLLMILVRGYASAQETEVGLVYDEITIKYCADRGEFSFYGFDFEIPECIELKDVSDLSYWKMLKLKDTYPASLGIKKITKILEQQFEHYAFSDWAKMEAIRDLANVYGLFFNEEELFVYGVAKALNYDVGLLLDNEEVKVAFYSENYMPGTAYIKNGKSYRAINHDFKTEHVIVSENMGAKPLTFSGKPFDVSKQADKRYEDGTLSFEFQDKEYEISFLLNKNMNAYLKSVPHLMKIVTESRNGIMTEISANDYSSYYKSFDPVTKRTIKSALTDAGLLNRNDRPYLIKLALAMAKNSLDYKTDYGFHENILKEKGKRDVPMFASLIVSDEVNQGDCEDFSTLFIAVLDLFEIPSVGVRVPGHIMAAIPSKEKLNGHRLANTNYYVVDPTNSDDINYEPDGLYKADQNGALTVKNYSIIYPS